MRLYYGLAAAAVFVTELVIALFVHDHWIRPYAGDALAVVLVYLAIRTVTPWPVSASVMASLGFAAALEMGQFFHIGQRLGLAGTPIGVFVLGGAFDVKDLACYGAGALCVVVVEAMRGQRLA